MEVVMPGAPPPSHRAPRRPVLALLHVHAQQERINSRFACIDPHDIDKEGVAIFVVEGLDPPQGFRGVWHVFDGNATVISSWRLEQIDNVLTSGVVLLVGDPHVTAHVKRLCHFAKDFCSVAKVNGPPIVFLPHSFSSRDNAQADSVDSNFLAILESGVDDVVAGEPEGWELACAVRCKKAKQRISKQRFQQQQLKFLQSSIENCLWTYLPARFKSKIPPLDQSLPPGIPARLNGAEVGFVLGRGRSGSVHPLKKEGASATEVVKCTDKTQITTAVGILSLANTVRIMTLITEDCPHPNLTKFYEAYQSQSHVIYRMEHGGDMDLCKRLALRDRVAQNAHLSSSKVVTIIAHISQAVWHLHDVCHVAHRDVKPENVCIQETYDNHITAKLTDFDVSTFANETRKCRDFVGTFPFTAPELFLRSDYYLLPTDMWSLGVLIYEVVCGARIFDRIFGLSNSCNRAEHTADRSRRLHHELIVMNSRIAQHFLRQDAAGNVLNTHLRSEIQRLAEPLRLMLEALCCTRVAMRSSAAQAIQHAQAIMNSQHYQGTEHQEVGPMGMEEPSLTVD